MFAPFPNRATREALQLQEADMGPEPTGNPQDPAEVAPAVASPNSDENSPAYGSQVSAMAPRQDMFAIDTLAGGPVEDRKGNPADFTGGDLEKGLGGQALGLEPGKTEVDGYEVGEKIGV